MHKKVELLETEIDFILDLLRQKFSEAKNRLAIARFNYEKYSKKGMIIEDYKDKLNYAQLDYDFIECLITNLKGIK